MALTQVPSTVAIGKIVHTVRRPDITAIKTARSAKVLAITSCAREKNRLWLNRSCPCYYPSYPRVRPDKSELPQYGAGGVPFKRLNASA